MPEQKGLLTKESVQRTIKSKWFLPALGIGGAVVVLLIVMNKRSGGTSRTSDESIVPEDTNMEAPLGTGETSDDLGAMFDELAGSISTQNQQQQEAIQAQLDAQNAAIQQTSSQLQGELASAISGLSSQQYVDPYASGAYASPDAGYGAFAEPAYTSYGVDDTGQTLTPVLEPTVSTSILPNIRTATGQAAQLTKAQQVAAQQSTIEINKAPLIAAQQAALQAGTYNVPSGSAPVIRTATGEAAPKTKAQQAIAQAQNTYTAPSGSAPVIRTATGQAVKPSTTIQTTTRTGSATPQQIATGHSGQASARGKSQAPAPKAKAQAPPPPKTKVKK